jgi:hypothetical protein
VRSASTRGPFRLASAKASSTASGHRAAQDGFLLDEAGAGAVNMMRTVKRAHNVLETTPRSINPHMKYINLSQLATC